ncbi:MAG TPA: hypothetical protein VGX03_00320 [Candidatus Binatia bacterium]|nr:hypothetical protein [Candidatus Binatia bacterium]
MVSLAAANALLYLAGMTNFYDPFFHHHNNGRGRRPEVSEILPTLFVGAYLGKSISLA